MNTSLRFIRFVFVGLILFLAETLQAQMRLQTDLVVHPKEVRELFDLVGQEVSRNAKWTWPEMEFAQPYKTKWNQLEALGPFAIRFTTEDWVRQELGFELLWNDPQVNVGQFLINDTVVRNVGGSRITFVLQGTCSNMKIRLPNGQWKIQGKMKWQPQGTGTSFQGISVVWTDFRLNLNPVQAEVDLGQCDGRPGLFQALTEAVQTVTKDSSWLEEVLRDGSIEFVQNALNDLIRQMMQPQKFQVSTRTEMEWKPESWGLLTGGSLRLSGWIEGAQTQRVEVPRDIETSDLDLLPESALILPRSAMLYIIPFLYEAGEFQWRVASPQVSGFQRLMRSRFLQFFVWPDLISFAKSTEFIFDLRAANAPVVQLGNIDRKGGTRYPFAANLNALMWAPAGSEYKPYSEFRVPASGEFYLQVDENEVQISTQMDRVKLKAKFRAEYQKYRATSGWIATGLLLPDVTDYLNTFKYSWNKPAWAFHPSMAVTLRDIQQWKNSTRIPLIFKRSSSSPK